jgi:hypothetical protein
MLTIATATPSLAQAPPDAPPHFEGSALFSYLGSQGNAKTQSLGAGVDAAWRPQPWTYRAKGSFAQNTTNDVLSAESIPALARASREIGKLWSGYLHEKGPTKDFDSSTGSLGLGYRYIISKTSDFTYKPRYRVPFANTGV